MTTDVLALREALERLRDAAQAFRGRRAVDWSDPTEKPLTDALVAASATLAAVRAETLAGSGVVERTGCPRCGRPGYPATGETDTWCSGGAAAVWCKTHGFEAAAPPTPVLTAARLAVAMHETTMGCANHGSDWHSYHIGVARILFAALAATPPTPAPALTAARCGYLIRMLGLTPFICNRAEGDALHRSRTHPDAHSFLTATHTPERLLDAIEAQAIGEVEA